MFIRKEKFTRSLRPVAFEAGTFRPASDGRFEVDCFWVEVVPTRGLVVKHGTLYIIPQSGGVFTYAHLFSSSDFDVVRVSDSAWNGSAGYVLDSGNDVEAAPRYSSEVTVSDALVSMHDLLPEVPVGVDGWYYWKEV